MSTVRHTPGPWRVGGGEQASHLEARIIRGPDGAYIARVQGITLAECQANAQHIVHCVNAHEGLINLLRRLEVDVAHEVVPGSVKSYVGRREISEAIAKAEAPT